MKNIPLACFTLALFSLLFMHCQCTPEPNCVELPGGKKYNANASVEIAPMQASYRIGDTIRVAVRIPDRSLLEGRVDSISLHLLEFEDLVIDLASLFIVNNNMPSFAEGEQYFTFIPLKGSLVPKPNPANPRFIAFEPVKDAQSRLMEFALIPLAKGTYKLGLFTPFTVSTGLCDDYCYSETQLYFPLADNRDSGNYHLARPYQSLLGAYDSYKQNGTFTFQVLE
jgi:hypothetical protein